MDGNEVHDYSCISSRNRPRHFWCYSNNFSTVHHTERKFELKVNDVVMTSQAYTQFTIIGSRTVNDVMQPACAAAHAQTDVLKRRDRAI